MNFVIKETFQIVLLLVIFNSSIASSISFLSLKYNKTITVNCTSSERCDGLSIALSKTQALGHSVLIQLSSGQFSLNSPANTTFTKWTDLAIVGTGPTTTSIICNQSVGFTFLNSSRIMLANVTFEQCGTLHTSTSRNFSASAMSFMKFYSALYFLFCKDITMENVVVSHSEGAGLVLYNTGGLNRFSSCKFQYSRLSIRGHNYPGGTGVTIDFSYCAPGDTLCRPPGGGFSNIASSYIFKGCTFRNNNGSSLNVKQKLVYPHGTDHMTFGKGGGVSINFGGRSIGNSMTFDTCTFNTNLADEGGGLYVKFGDVSTNNTLIVANSSFSRNSLDCSDEKANWTSAGGGAKVDFIHYPPDNDTWPDYDVTVQDNTVRFTTSWFTENKACYGGAVSFVTSREPSGTINSNTLNFNSCHFESNQADISAALDLSVHHPDQVKYSGGLMHVTFTDCSFKDNCISFGNINHYPFGMGILYSDRVPLQLAGNNNFTSNEGTALVVLSTYVEGMESSLTNFSSNSGRLGGAVALVGNSWLIAHENSLFTFSGNWVKAGGVGGAIYSVHFGEHDLPYQQNCFFQYHKPTLHPQDWTAKFVFTDNLANGESNSIYTTSVLPCLWPSTNHSAGTSSPEKVFCEGHPWYFTGSDCKHEIMTASSTLRVPKSHRIKAVPGWGTRLGVTAVDDYQNEIQTVLVAFPDDEYVGKIGVNNSTMYISNDTIILFGEESFTSMLNLRTLDPRVIVSDLAAEILPCPPGFVSVPCANASGLTCDCVCPNEDSGLTCDIDTRNITLNSHYCLTYQYNNDNTPNKSLPLVLGKCPFQPRSLKLPQLADNLDDIVCDPFKRTGLLCSSCKTNYSVAINSKYECVPCNPAIGWLLFLAVKILPVTVLFFLVALLNIKATSAALNAFVFYSQIISVSSFHNPYPFYFGVLKFGGATTRSLIALVELPYSILNLDFFRGVVPPFCIGNIGTLSALALNYIVAVYPILLIVVCYVCIQLYDRNFTPARMLWKPFKWCLGKLHKKKKPTTSIIDAFATFLLLSYTTFMYNSFPLLQPVTVRNASSSEHEAIFKQQKFFFNASVDALGNMKTIAIFAVVIALIIVFVVAPPLFLILYPFKYVQSCISRVPKNIALKTFAESFTECFRNGTERPKGRDFRYFAGLYFLFRIAIFAVFLSDLYWVEQYFIQQVLFTLGMLLFALARPYKKDFYNYLDTSVFALLALLNAFSFYNSQVMQLKGFDNMISIPVFVINYLLLFLPLLYVVGYAIHYCLFSLHCLSVCYKKESSTSESIVVITDSTSRGESTEEPFSYDYDYNELQGEDRDFPDRVVNPQNYGPNLYRPVPPRIMITKATDDRTSDRADFEVSTENSYFLERQRRQVYGATESRNQQSRSHSEPKPKSGEFRRLV